MVDIKAIGTTLAVVVMAGAAFIMIYWTALIIFPLLVLTAIAAITYGVSSTNNKQNERPPPKFDFRG